MRPIISMFKTATVLARGLRGFWAYAQAPKSPDSSEFQGKVILSRLQANAGLFSGEDLEEIGSSLVMRLLDHLFALPGSEPTWQL